MYLGLLNGVRDVAVKVVTSENPEQQMRFIREIAILKSCRDPNIVQFLGASVLRQQTFMVMQVTVTQSILLAAARQSQAKAAFSHARVLGRRESQLHSVSACRNACASQDFIFLCQFACLLRY